MKHGISFLPDVRPGGRTPAQYYADVLSVSRLADEGGLDFVKMTEHYLGTYGGYCPSPLTFLSAVAAQTTSIRLMTGCLLPAFHHPVQIAAQTAMVDALSNGRLDVGFARAWLPYEFEAFGVPMDSSRSRFEQTIEAVVRLWTQEKVSEETDYFAYENVTSTPPVTQNPHPPVWGAAIRSPQSFAWLARKGFGLLVSLPPLRRELRHTRELIQIYRDTFAEAHPDGRIQPRVAVAVPLMVARTDAEARRVAVPAIREYLDVTAEAAATWTMFSSSNYPGYENMSRAYAAVTLEDLESDAAAVIGSPASAAEQVQELIGDLRPDVCLWNVDYGGQDLNVMRGSLELFISDVLPLITVDGDR